MIEVDRNIEEARCIHGERVISLLNGKELKFDKNEHIDEAHWPIRLIGDKKRKLLLL